MKELVAYIRENMEVEKAVPNLSYEEIVNMYPDLGEKFEEFTQNYNDLLYLFADEFFDMCQKGTLTDKESELIQKRKAKRPLAEAYWNKSISEILATEGDDIKGISGSIGKVTGKVCAVKGADEFDRLKEGEILVCSYTDPEWTPLVTLAAGVVVDTGGSLSHAASCVCRDLCEPKELRTIFKRRDKERNLLVLQRD